MMNLGSRAGLMKDDIELHCGKCGIQHFKHLSLCCLHFDHSVFILSSNLMVVQY